MQVIPRDTSQCLWSVAIFFAQISCFSFFSTVSPCALSLAVKTSLPLLLLPSLPSSLGLHTLCYMDLVVTTMKAQERCPTAFSILKSSVRKGFSQPSWLSYAWAESTLISDNLWVVYSIQKDVFILVLSELKYVYCQIWLDSQCDAKITTLSARWSSHQILFVVLDHKSTKALYWTAVSISVVVQQWINQHAILGKLESWIVLVDNSTIKITIIKKFQSYTNKTYWLQPQLNCHHRKLFSWIGCIIISSSRQIVTVLKVLGNAMTTFQSGIKSESFFQYTSLVLTYFLNCLCWKSLSCDNDSHRQLFY